MPKQTFYNLTDEKREKIIEASIEEFAHNQYLNASITKIAEKADVAKGSMYQYFQDKKDLYKFILDMIGQRKMAYMKDVIDQKDKIDFIPLLRLLFVGGLEFTIQNPKLASIANNFIKEQHSEIREDILKDIQEKSNLFFIDMIDRAKERGDVRDEVSSEMGADMVYHMNNVLIDWVDMTRLSQGDQVSIDDYLVKVDNLLEIMKFGYQKQKGDKHA